MVGVRRVEEQKKLENIIKDFFQIDKKQEKVARKEID